MPPIYAVISNLIAPYNQRLQADVPLRVTRLSRKALGGFRDLPMNSVRTVALLLAAFNVVACDGGISLKAPSCCNSTAAPCTGIRLSSRTRHPQGHSHRTSDMV